MPSFETELEMAVPASLLWKTLVHAHITLPKMAPLFIVSIDVLQGTPGQVGEVTRVNLGPIAPDGAFVEEKRIELNAETLTIASEELAGGHLAVGFSKWVARLKLVPIGDDKVKVTSSVDYETEENADVSLAIQQAKDGLPMLFHSVEQYLTSTPDAFHHLRVGNESV
ncbi:hypothetical protein R1sor_026815 [Riccia sorocarpa]|uniref:Bet v I/Major latex protein domain-containing protein n=1 Tax=Riccia sorocarpa TaxID=122646 RepID=A0ABD3GFD4_9MARC